MYHVHTKIRSLLNKHRNSKRVISFLLSLQLQTLIFFILLLLPKEMFSISHLVRQQIKGLTNVLI